MPDPTLPAKPWWQSRTIWGAIIVLVSALLQQIAGIALSDTEQGHIANVLTALGEGVGFVLTIVGRLRAERLIAR